VDPPPPADAPRRLTRSSTDSVIGGVSGGLGRYFAIDPILFRIGFVVITLAGGAGLLAYLALWFLVEDETGASARWPAARNIALIAGGSIAVLIFVSLLPGPDFFIWPGFFGLVALGVLAIAIAGADRGGDTRSRVVRGLLVTAAVFAAATAGVAAGVGTAFGGGAVVAGIVIVLGLGLVAGAFSGGRRWLIVPALVLAAPAALVEAADLHVTGGVGEREYRPTTVSDVRDTYRLGLGEMVIDLRAVDFPAGRTAMRVELGAGEARVIVPDDVCVSSRTEMGAGGVSVFGRDNSGVDVDWSQIPRNEANAPELFIDAEIDLGELRIMHAADADEDHEFGNRYHDDASGPVAQAACSG
jgi:phage shock protein PspC (stress-responsive transcriptional regulator)